MRVRYIGSLDPTEHQQTTVHGQTYHLGVWTDSDNAKLAGNPMFEVDVDGDAQIDPDGYAAMTVPQLKALAGDRGVDLGDATKKADIIAMLELADED